MRRTFMMAVPLLVSIGLLLSACFTTDAPKPVYGYGLPYGSVDLVDWR